MLTAAPPTPPDSRWFANIRNIALIACITSLGGLVIPLRDATLALIEVETANPRVKAWITIALIFAYLVAAIVPIFYFALYWALYRNARALRVARRFRPLALGGVALSITEVARSFGKFWAGISGLNGSFSGAIGTAIRSPLAIYQASHWLGELSDIAQILLLVALFRKANEEPPVDAAVSKLLRFVSGTSAIVIGGAFAFNLLRLILSPVGYFYLRSLAGKFGKAGPAYWQIVSEMIPAVLSGAGLFVASYIVYRSSEERVHERTPTGISAS